MRDGAALPRGGLRVSLAHPGLDQTRSPKDDEIGALDAALNARWKEIVVRRHEAEVDSVALTEAADLIVNGLGATNDQESADARPITLEGHAGEPPTLLAAGTDGAIPLGIHP